jgi:aminomethyltransferase
MHQKYGGKMIEFNGWELPVEYEGIIAEHMKVRKEAGLFDVSHMGEIEVSGQQAESFIQLLVTNDISTLADGKICYALMCHADGGVVDDLLIYKYDRNRFLLVVNAANTDKDFSWIAGHALPGWSAVKVSDLSANYAQLALQGPLAEEILRPVCNKEISALDRYRFDPDMKIGGVSCMISRSGYTGEDGFEIYMDPDHAAEVWETILATGGNRVRPIGLGARDTLRCEARLPLYGHEIGRDITPLEAGLDLFVKFDKGKFIGREMLWRQKEDGPPRILVEFEMVEKGIPRSNYEVRKGDQKIGWVTSGVYAPYLKTVLGLALVKREDYIPGEGMEIIIRDRPVKARMTKSAFYKRYKKIHQGATL